MNGALVKQLLELRQHPQWNDWRWHWSRRREMGEILTGISGEKSPSPEPLVTPYYLQLVDFSDPHCPILRQILPTSEERADYLFETVDPLHEEKYMPLPGLIHRYANRVLWILAADCGAICRFCTRRRKLGHPEEFPDSGERQEALKYISGDANIREVILSGGDPLSLSTPFLREILVALRKIPHLHSIRLHSRLPVTLPQRLDNELMRLFGDFYPLTLVTHFNHTREVTPEAESGIRRMRREGVLVLNQAVLLNGVNDSLQSQEKLHLKLLRAGVKPYYLHQCDEVRGVSHFVVSPERGLRIMEGLRNRLPGIALPLYMIDLPRGGGKVPLEISIRVPFTGIGSRS